MSSCEALAPVLEGPDADLAARDPALPMLPLLLDDAVLGAWLSARLGEPVLAQRQYLRYKIGTACVAAVRLRPASSATGLPGRANEVRPDDRTVMLAHWAEGSRSKLTKTRAKAAAGSLLLVDDVAGIVVSTPAADRDLPAMGRLEDPRRRGEIVRRLVGSSRFAGPDLKCLTLSYKPQRRWVALMSSPGGEHALLRAYRPSDLAAHVAASSALPRDASPVPTLLGTDERLGLAAFEWVEGGQLRLPDHGDHVGSLGAVVASLHTHRLGLPGRSVGSRTRGLRETASLASTLLPELHGRLTAVTSAATRTLRGLEAPEHPVTLHGDLSCDQVVLTPGGGVRLIDLDRARSGHRADDIGSLVATAHLDGLHSDRLVPDLLEGYARHAKAPTQAAIDTYTAVHLLERATDAFRQARPDWADRLVLALTEAEELLARVPVVGQAL